MKKIINNLVFLTAAGWAQMASANCVVGTPEANAAVASSITNLQVLNDVWFATEFDLQNKLGWKDSRGVSDPLNTDLEYNKTMLAAILLGGGVDSTKLDVWQNPATGDYEYREGQIYLNPAFHRSDDEWLHLVSDTTYKVCDHLNPNNGKFECEKEGKWPGKHYRTFGKTTRSGIEDNVPQEIIGDVFNADSWGAYETGAFSRDTLNYFCPMYSVGDEVDEFSITHAVEFLALTGWHALLRKEKKKETTEFKFSGFGVKEAAIARSAVDAGLGGLQIREQALCDLTLASEDWVPLMVVELMNVVSNIRSAEKKYKIGNSLGQTSPFTCGLLTDILTLTPGVDLCPSGELACDDASDCTGVGDYICSSGCCELDDDGGIIH